MAFPAALSHGTSRGNACLAISPDDEDRHLFLKTLQDVVTRYHLSQERFWLQLYPYAHAIGAVHVEHIDACPAHRCETDDAPSLEAEVRVPVIGAGVEEACQLTGFGVYAREVRPFVTIAEMTGEGEIKVVVAPMMLPRHDVLDVKRDEIVTLMDATIFTAVSRSVAHA
jgi:hypothetical protein